MRFAWSLAERREREGLFGMGPACLGNRRHRPGHLAGPVAERANAEWRESEPSAPGRRISEAEAMSAQSTRQHHQAGTFAVEQMNAISVYMSIYSVQKVK